MIKRILNYIFKAKEEEQTDKTELVEPLVGEWFLIRQDHTDNPFEKKNIFAARVKDAKAGYVLYAIAPFGGLWQNESRDIKTFLGIYRAATQEEAELLTSKYL